MRFSVAVCLTFLAAVVSAAPIAVPKNDNIAERQVQAPDYKRQFGTGHEWKRAEANTDGFSGGGGFGGPRKRGEDTFFSGGVKRDPAAFNSPGY